MPTAVTYLGFGTCISAVGIAFVLFHVRSHRRHVADDKLSAAESRFFEHQYLRRMQTSGLTVTLGALIALCGYSKIFENSPVFATFYVVGLLLLTFWLILLAVSDAIATRVHSSRLDRRNPEGQKTLQEALADVREAHKSGPGR